MRLREATIEDEKIMETFSVSKGNFKKTPESTSYIYTLEHDDKVLAMGGIVLITPTTAWCWVDLSVDAFAHIVTVYRTIKEWLDTLVVEKKIKRLQAYVLSDIPEAVNLVEHLGFNYEYTMPCFAGETGNTSAHLYSKIF